MEIIASAIGTALQWQNLIAVVAGVLTGIIIGALPGLGPAVGVALLIPFTYALPTETSLILLTALYMAAEYGGSISAILISTPGTPAAAATTLDGYPMAQNGEPGKALTTSLYASVIGGIIGVIILISLSIPLARFALKFGPAEYFALGVFGLSIVSSLSGKSMLKGFAAAVLGLLLSTVGVDTLTGYTRLSFGFVDLMEGFPFIPVLIGLFAMSEVFNMIEGLAKESIAVKKFSVKFASLLEFKKVLPTVFKGSLIGSFIGILPGAGGAIACWVSYNEAKRTSRHPEKFGTGIMEGIAAPESANNATVGGAMIPLLALGIPGSGTTAVLLGALIMHGLTPGPKLFTEHTAMIYSLFAGLMLSNFLLLAFGLGAIRMWVKVLKIPTNVLAPIIFILGVIGSYGVRNNMFDVLLMFVFGLMGYFLKKYDYSVPAIVLAMILGFMIESNLRRALIISDGSFLVILTQPICLMLIVIAVLTLVMPMVRQFKSQRNSRTGAN